MNDDAFGNLISRLADRGGSGAPEPAEDARLSQKVSDEAIAVRKALVVRAGALYVNGVLDQQVGSFEESLRYAVHPRSGYLTNPPTVPGISSDNPRGRPE